MDAKLRLKAERSYVLMNVFPGLFSSSHMDYEVERDRSPTGQPSLSQMTEAAITLLENQDGYVLMVRLINS
jgi:alkaline phosphatase